MSCGYSADRLGEVVRDLRDRQGMTQQALGRAAGYGAGAGVSISRLESGLLRPGAERFRGIAEALGLTPEELEARASAGTDTGQKAVSRDSDVTSQAVDWAADAGTTLRRQAELKDRAERIQHEIDDRVRIVTELSGAFNTNHDRARDEFFMRFVELAARVEGAPQPDPTRLQEDDEANVDAVARHRIESNSAGVRQLLAASASGAAAGAAVGSAAAYGTFFAVASLGTASTGAAISGLSGVAATNATLAVLGGGTVAAGGAGVAGGSMVLASIVAAPAVILAAGGLLWMRKRSRKQQRELAEKFDEAEAALAATKPGVEALVRILPRATELLDYIATHGGHALTRWESQLGQGPLSWNRLSAADRERYRGFVDIAAAQLTIVTIDFQGLLATPDGDRDDRLELAETSLLQSELSVTRHV